MRTWCVQVLRTYLAQIFSSSVLAAPGTHPQLLPGLGRALPASTAKQDFTSLIEGLPEADDPALFGLPANIERSIQQANSTRVIGQLRQMSIAQVRGREMAG